MTSVTKNKLLLSILAAIFISAFSQTSLAQDGQGCAPNDQAPAPCGDECKPPCPPCPPDCPMMGGHGRGMHCGPGGSGGACDMPQRHMGGDRPGPGMQGFCGPEMPEALRTQLEQLRKDCETLRGSWENAVLTRGQTSIDDVRASFEKDNAAAIASLEKLRLHLEEDMRALRECPVVAFGKDGREGGFCMPGPGPDLGPREPDGSIRATIDAEVAQALNSIKGQIDVEAYVRIRNEVLEKHRDEIREAIRARIPANGFGAGMPIPDMGPQLARMREAMCQIREAPLADRAELRRQLREAMKIQDAAKRSAEIDRILGDNADSGEQPRDGHGPQNHGQQGQHR